MAKACCRGSHLSRLTCMVSGSDGPSSRTDATKPRLLAFGVENQQFTANVSFRSILIATPKRRP